VFSFLRWNGDEQLIIVSNFEETDHKFQLKLDLEVIQKWNLKNGSYKLHDQLSGTADRELIVKEEDAFIDLKIRGLESFIFKL
jgi:hypothetical protein